MPSVRARLQMDKKAICSIGMAAYLGEPNDDPATVYGRTGDLGPAWDGVLNVIFASNEETWEKEGEKPGFPSWESDYDYGRHGPYWQWKVDAVGHERLMDLTGYMRAQMTGKTGDHWEYRGRQHMEMGSRNPTAPGEGFAGEHGINLLDPRGDDITGHQAYAHNMQFVSPKKPWKPFRPAHTVIRFTESEIDELCEQILDHVTHARRLKRPWRVVPSRSSDPMRQGHFIQGRVRDWG